MMKLYPNVIGHNVYIKKKIANVLKGFNIQRLQPMRRGEGHHRHSVRQKNRRNIVR